MGSAAVGWDVGQAFQPDKCVRLESLTYGKRTPIADFHCPHLPLTWYNAFHPISITLRESAALNTSDLEFVDETVERLGRRTEAVIPILQAIQSHFRYLPREAMERVCRLTEITPATIEGVSTFYTQFRHRPVGQHIISVCHGTACHVKGSELVQDALERQLGIARGSDTTPRGCSPSRRLPAWAAARWPR